MMKLPEFQYGAPMPDELTLADRFGVSRGTMRIPLAEKWLPERKRVVGMRLLPNPAAELKRNVE